MDIEQRFAKIEEILTRWDARLDLMFKGCVPPCSLHGQRLDSLERWYKIIGGTVIVAVLTAVLKGAIL